MKKLLLVAALGSSALLGGCDPANLAQIQQATTVACGFVPTAVLVASVIPQSAPFAAPAEAIAQAICAAVTTKKMSRYRGVSLGTITVPVTLPNGKTAKVTGYFVR